LKRFHAWEEFSQEVKLVQSLRKKKNSRNERLNKQFEVLHRAHPEWPITAVMEASIRRVKNQLDAEAR
tara:strand:- start:376 stop:579 length:204 start_codon:yes stop_codon:yes gene_type:complete